MSAFCRRTGFSSRHSQTKERVASDLRFFRKEEESYWVEFPALKGCNTNGSTIPEAMEMAQEALLSKIQA